MKKKSTNFLLIIFGFVFLIGFVFAATCENVGEVLGNQYCGIDGVLYDLKVNGADCINSYECSVGLCSEGVCGSAYTPIVESNNFWEEIFNSLNNLKNAFTLKQCDLGGMKCQEGAENSSCGDVCSGEIFVKTCEEIAFGATVWKDEARIYVVGKCDYSAEKACGGMMENEFCYNQSISNAVVVSNENKTSYCQVNENLNDCYSCNANYSWNGSACVSGGEPVCFETDGGLNYSVRGNCTSSLNGLFSDACFGGISYEFFCNSSTYYCDNVSQACGNGKSCYNGLCVPAIPGTVCGDNIVNGTEECDGTNLTGETCESLVDSSGQLSCGSNCIFDVSECESPPNPPPNCIPDWNCTDWSNVAGNCGTRICFDENSCGASSGKPAESKDCSRDNSYCGDGVCNKIYELCGNSDKSPECNSDCEKCEIALKNCGNGICDAEENSYTCLEDCKSPKSKKWIFVVLIILLVMGIGVLIFFIIKKIKKNKKKKLIDAGHAGVNPSPTPPRTPPARPLNQQIQQKVQQQIQQPAQAKSKSIEELRQKYPFLNK